MLDNQTKQKFFEVYNTLLDAGMAPPTPEEMQGWVQNMATQSPLGGQTVPVGMIPNFHSESGFRMLPEMSPQQQGQVPPRFFPGGQFPPQQFGSQQMAQAQPSQLGIGQGAGQGMAMGQGQPMMGGGMPQMAQAMPTQGGGQGRGFSTSLELGPDGRIQSIRMRRMRL